MASNVTLHPGVMQGWSDLSFFSVGVGSAVLERLRSRRCKRLLVAGAAPPVYVRQLAEQADCTLVVVRAAADGFAIASEVEDLSAEVRVGCLEAALADEEPFDLIVTQDLALLATAEQGLVTWRSLAEQLVSARTEDGLLLLAVESDVHRSWPPVAPDAGEDYALSTWDASRPRTTEQLEAWIGDQPHATWQTALTWPDAFVAWTGDLDDTLRAALPGIVAAEHPILDVFTLRSHGLADSLTRNPSGWLVGIGAHPERPCIIDNMWLSWVSDDGRLIRRDPAGQQEVPTPQPLLIPLVEAAANRDMPSMRALLGQWRAAVEDAAIGGELPSGLGDVWFGNVSLQDGQLHVTIPCEGIADLVEAQQEALAGVISLIVSTGLRHPWPLQQDPQTWFKALCAMAGVPEPEPGQWRFGPDREGGPQELRQVVAAQKAQLEAAWARVRWNQQRYAVHRVAKAVRDAATPAGLKKLLSGKF